MLDLAFHANEIERVTPFLQTDETGETVGVDCGPIVTAHAIAFLSEGKFRTPQDLEPIKSGIEQNTRDELIKKNKEEDTRKSIRHLINSLREEQAAAFGATLAKTKANANNSANQKSTDIAQSSSEKKPAKGFPTKEEQQKIQSDRQQTAAKFGVTPKQENYGLAWYKKSGDKSVRMLTEKLENGRTTKITCHNHDDETIKLA